MPTPDHPGDFDATRLRVWLITTFFGLLIGTLYTYIIYELNGDGSSQTGFWLGGYIGGAIAMLASGFELFVVAHPQTIFRRLSFMPLLLVRTLILGAITIFGIVSGQFLHDVIHGTRFLDTDEGYGGYIQDLSFSVVVCAAIIFYMQMRLFIGGRTLTNLMLGRYNAPVNEERIFMFIDILGATATAQSIGDIRFHRYLSELFVLFDGPITRNGGEVHSYVGDAIIAVWPLSNDRRKNARVIKTLAEINAICERQRGRLEKLYGVKPGIRAAVHGGSVVIGETGYSKRQITYLGDTVNITSRIEAKAKELARHFLISGSMVKRIAFPDMVRLEDLGDFAVKGAAKPVSLTQIHFEQ